MSNDTLIRTLLLVGALLVLGPLLLAAVFSFGAGSTSMMGGGMMFFGAPMFGGWFLFVLLLLGVGFLLLNDRDDSTRSTERTAERTTQTNDLDGAVERGEIDEDAALATLRERYARGELDDEAFERKVETLLETESPESARDRVRERDL